MKLWDILKTVGSAALQVALPGTGSLIVGAVNEFLPDDKKLPAGATGNAIGDAIARLPAADQAAVMEKEFDVEITQIKESYSTVRTMLESEAKSPHSTRPYIAKGSFHVVAFSILLIVSVWSYGVISGDSAMVKAVVDGWPFILAAIGPLVALLRSYFGVLKHEQKNKLDAACGHSTPAGVSGILSKILNRGGYHG